MLYMSDTNTVHAAIYKLRENFDLINHNEKQALHLQCFSHTLASNNILKNRNPNTVFLLPTHISLIYFF